MHKSRMYVHISYLVYVNFTLLCPPAFTKTGRWGFRLLGADTSCVKLPELGFTWKLWLSDIMNILWRGLAPIFHNSDHAVGQINP